MENLLLYVESLAKKHYEEIGFIPTPRIEAYSRAGQMDVAFENDDPCGFLIWGNGFPCLKIYQACIQYDAQRRRHGLDLVRKLIRKADVEGYESISLWCADDLDSNEFWRSCGFVWSGSRNGGTKRGRKHNRWIMWMPKPLQLGLLPYHNI